MESHTTRVPLACLPTPVHELKRLSQALGGPRLLVKRDDLTGLAMGGNKARKLEYLMADALNNGAHTVVTAGAAQSNHARQTAAAAAQYGLRCVLILSPLAPSAMTGNLLLDELMGAHIRWTGDRDPYAVMDEVLREERAAGRKPYAIPLGGSNAVGAAAYVQAMKELARQTVEQDVRLDHIILASSSGGTQAGLVTGASAIHFAGHILGISISRSAETLKALVTDLARLTAAHLGLRIEIDPEAVRVNDDYLGEGYGVLSATERETRAFCTSPNELYRSDPRH